jgi:uncharacterized Tic20 family protein
MTSQFPQYSEYVPTSPAAQAPRPPMHPSLGLAVTPEQRDRAERFLAEAYADGRLNEFEFDARMDQVLGAQTRKDLNQAFYGLVDVPSTSRALGLHPAYHPSLVNQNRDGRAGRAAAAIAHLSPFVSWIFGPLFVYLVAGKGTFAKHEAAKAFNFQIISTVAFVLGGILTGIFDGAMGPLMGLLGVAWFVLTLIHGVKAAQGEDWQNPVRKVVKWELLDEK